VRGGCGEPGLIWVARDRGFERYKHGMDASRCLVLWATSLLLALALPARAQEPGRGELLYTTHCGACHNVQMHWRENKLATNWPTLLSQVQRWQGVAQLGWSQAEIEDVARYLNQTIYRYPEPVRVGRLTRP
jgi:mono/diheme cytochrome c family protein